MYYGNLMSEADVQAILDLQHENWKKTVSVEEAKTQGFVTVKHDFEVLRDMWLDTPQVIAKSGEKLAGYALVMPPHFFPRVPILQALGDLMEKIDYAGQKIAAQKYFIMGQVCVAKDFRGQGVFDGMYHAMRDANKDKYAFVVTEVAARNTRSMRAHERVGFKTIYNYTSSYGEEWNVVLWDWE